MIFFFIKKFGDIDGHRTDPDVEFNKLKEAMAESDDNDRKSIIEKPKKVNFIYFDNFKTSQILVEINYQNWIVGENNKTNTIWAENVYPT